MRHIDHISARTSFVIQGPVWGKQSDPPEARLTEKVIASIRNLMPGAEIILSSWQGTDCGWLKVDKVVLSKDPGAPLATAPGFPLKYSNHNRQIISTRAGLDVAEGELAIKIRSDTLLESSIDFSFLNAKPQDAQYVVLSAPILVPNVYTRNPLKRPVLFHLSDLFHAGRLCDLKKLWDIPLFGNTEPIFEKARTSLMCDAFPGMGYVCRCCPEQFLGTSLLSATKEFKPLKHHSEFRPELLLPWLGLLAQNFVIKKPEIVGVRFPKRIQIDSTAPDLFQDADEDWLDQIRNGQLPVSKIIGMVTTYCARSARSTPPLRAMESFFR